MLTLQKNYFLFKDYSYTTKIFFIIFSSISGFFVGTSIAGITLPKSSGLEGGATVFVYGIFGFVFALVLSLFIMQKIKPALLKKITIVLLVLNLLFVGWIILRVLTLNHHDEPLQKKTKPVVTPVSFFHPQQKEQTEMGLEMAKPDLFNKRVLYFYSPNLEKSVSEHLPIDSLVFTQTEHHQYDISYAPPWFCPEILKMDYEILYMKVITLSRDWFEVEVNRETGLTTWISATDATVLLWPEFLLSVFSIENLYPESNLLRVKPLSHASPIMEKEFSFLSPVMVKGSWIKVNLIDDDFNKVGEAWIQWHSDGKLLVSYSLLS